LPRFKSFFQSVCQLNFYSATRTVKIDEMSEFFT